jgi:mRNA interferase RelE/StbE
MSESRVWRIEFDSDAARDLRKLGAEPRRLILRYLRQRLATAEDPRRFGRPLTGDLKGLWRYRIGDYRIVAAIEENRFIVLIVTVGHRREVYD